MAREDSGDDWGWNPGVIDRGDEGGDGTRTVNSGDPDINEAGAGSDPFAYTNGSLLTPWTQTFTPSHVPSGGYYQGSGGYSPSAPFQYPDFAYDFHAPAAFSGGDGQFQAPGPFSYRDFQAPEGFKPPPAFVAPRFERPADFVAPDVTEDPGYKFRLKQGLDALQNSAAAKGILRTGGTYKGLEDYAQESASQEYGAAYDRRFKEYAMGTVLDEDTYDRNYRAGLDESEIGYGRASSEYDRNFQNALTTYQLGYNKASGEYDRNFQNAYNVNNSNFNNSLNAWRQNADVSLEGQNLGYGVASGTWDRNYGKGVTSYQDQVQQRETAASIDSSEASAGAGSAQWADQTNYNRDLQGYNIGYETFNNNQTNQFNRLFALAGLGTQGSGQAAGLAGQFGANAGNLTTGAGNAGAAGQVGAGNATAAGLGNIANMGNLLLALGLTPARLPSAGGGSQTTGQPNPPR